MEKQREHARVYVNRNYQTDFWDVNNSELLQGTIQAIAQSPDGFLWLATQGGLARFDGVEFQMYDTQRFPEIHNDFLTDVKVGNDSTVWCATFGGGIFSVKNGTLRSIDTDKGLSSGWVQKLVVTSQWGVWYRSLARIGQIVDTSVVENWGLAGSQMSLYGQYYGSLWAGTEEGLLRFENGSWNRVPFGRVEFGLANDLHIDSTGRYWIATENGLYSGYEFELSRHERLRMNIRDVNMDSRGRVWVSTYQHGVYVLDGRKIDHYGLSDGLGSDNIRWTFEDSRGTVWICDEAGGLSLVDRNGTFIPQVDEFLLGRAHVQKMYEDREGNLWVGTFAGIARVKPRRVRMLTMDDGLQAPTVLSIAEAPRGGVYLGTNKGLALLQNDRIISTFSSSGLPQVPLTALFLDSKNVLWIGTIGAGLWSLDGAGAVKRFPAEGRQAPRIIRSINEVGNDSLLLGTNTSTLLIGVRGRIATVLESDTTDGRAMTTHRDDRNNLWLGMENGVIKEYGPGRAGVRMPLSVDSERYPISFVTTDQDGSLWCSTLGAGLARLRQGVPNVDAATHYLPNGKFNWVLRDKTGALWIGTNKGVASVSSGTLEDAGKDPPFMRFFESSDGLLSMETIAWTQSPAVLRSDGTLIFGTLKGVAFINTNVVGRNEMPPPLILDRIVVSGEVHRSFAGPITFPAGRNDMEFHYTAPSLVASERNRFRYRLEGYDPAWIEANSRRVAYYTNVPPGTYRFFLQASNNDGVWSDRTEMAVIVLEPYFYQTAWFYVLCGLGVFGLGVGAQKLIGRYRNEKELSERLQSKLDSAQLHALRMQLHPHFLFNTLNAISSMILTRPRQAVTMVGQLSEMLRMSLEKEHIQYTTLKEEIGFLNKYLSIEQVRFGSRLSVKMHIEEGTERAMIPTFLLQPLVENAIKHGVSTLGRKGEIQIDASRVNGNLKICIQDDGRGGAEGPLREGVGLGNTRSRLQQLYGDRYTLTLLSKPDRGFLVDILLPLAFAPSGEKRP